MNCVRIFSWVKNLNSEWSWYTIIIQIISCLQIKDWVKMLLPGDLVMKVMFLTSLFSAHGFHTHSAASLMLVFLHRVNVTQYEYLITVYGTVDGNFFMCCIDIFSEDKDNRRKVECLVIA